MVERYFAEDLFTLIFDDAPQYPGGKVAEGTQIVDVNLTPLQEVRPVRSIAGIALEDAALVDLAGRLLTSYDSEQ